MQLKPSPSGLRSSRRAPSANGLSAWQSALEQAPLVAAPVGNQQDDDRASADTVDQAMIPEQQLSELANAKHIEFGGHGTTLGKAFERVDPLEQAIEQSIGWSIVLLSAM